MKITLAVQCRHDCRTWLQLVLWLITLICSSWISAGGAEIQKTLPALPSEFIKVPPPPEIAPLIGGSYPNDTNADRIDDQLFERARRAQVGEMVDVEVIFRRQITQQQLDAFVQAGGEINYIYRAVSYGWNGRVPLTRTATIPALMGDDLILIQQVKPAKLHLDTATRTGRVRPIWAANFAGNPAGYDGANNITIATCDTGADESHADLTGRRVYWHDFSTDASASPIDILQHGSHVMGIATGTGASSGSSTSTLRFSDENTLTGVPGGSFYPNTFELPASAVTVNLVSRWNGGGSTTLYLVYHNKGVSTSSGLTSLGSISGTSPLTLTLSFTGSSSREYSPALLSNGSISEYVTVCQVTNYPAPGDGFNKLRGVAPDCNWGCAKVFANNGSSLLSWTDAALDDLVVNRVANNIKVINLSLGAMGSPGISASTRQKVNTVVNNGFVVCCSAGNDGGTQQVDDPGRAAMALTVAAANDVNQLTDYTSEGFSSPVSVSGQEEDYKPDLMAPGGSADFYSEILSIDSNSADGVFTDQAANDYLGLQGTSMASPFVAGCAALVIDALQQTGVSWSFASSQHSRFVKMVLCATATESNSTREDNTSNPSLQRSGAGPTGFPTGKDQYEGYGMINPDAAVEAVALDYTRGSTLTATLGPQPSDRRAWARHVCLAAGLGFSPVLTVPAGADFDLYLYSTNSSTYGTPVLLASSTSAFTGGTETFTYTPAATTRGILVVKRISGSGTFSLTTPPPGTPVITSVKNIGGNICVTFNTIPCQNYSVQYKNHLNDLNWTTAQSFTGDGSPKQFCEPLSSFPYRFYRLLAY